MNSVEIAEKHGMGAETVRWRLNKWKPGCFVTDRRPPRQPRERTEREGKPLKVIAGPTFVRADDGQVYEVGRVWLRDWAFVSFDSGVVEVLVEADHGNPRAAINATNCPVVLEQALIGVRLLPDRHGVQGRWRAFEARPKAQGQRFPRRLLPNDQEPASEINGALLFDRSAI